MNQFHYDPNTAVIPEIVDSPKKKSNLGCILGSIFGGVGLLLVGLVFLTYLALTLVDRSRERELERELAQYPDLHDEVRRELHEFKTRTASTVDATDHPNYERVVEFIDSMQAVLDDSANPELREFIDYSLYLDECIKRSRTWEDEPFLRAAQIEQLKQRIIGPPNPWSYEILRIEDDGPRRLRVYLNYSESYDDYEPHIWWLSDRGGLKIYDWSQLDYGTRASMERATIVDSTDAQRESYRRYANLCYEYLATAEGDLDYYEENRLIASILTQCESYAGPEALRPQVYLATARRWYYHGDSERAFSLAKRITQPELAPGVFRLIGDIHFERHEYKDAADSYRRYASLLGQTSYIQSQIAACFRESGDLESERLVLLETINSIDEDNFDSVALLVEVNNEAQNQELFSRLDSLECRDAAYMFLVNRFSDTEYFADRREQILKHLKDTAPQSGAAMLAQLATTNEVEQLVAVLKWIDEQETDDDQGQRFNFWYELDEDQVADVFANSPNPEQDFETIWSVYDYEATISNEVLLKVCESVLESKPEDFEAHYRAGYALAMQEDHEAAIIHLRKSLGFMPEENEEREFVEQQLINALYNSGDNSAAVALATNETLAVSLLSLKSQNDDFENFPDLLKQLESESQDAVYYQALLDYSQGKKDVAIQTIASLLSDLEEQDTLDYRAYGYRNELIEICEKNGDITEAYQQAPSDAMFRLVRNRLIQKFDWSGCERFLESDALANNELHRVQLRHQIDWERGNYERVVANANQLLDFAKAESLSSEVEQLVRSALRVGKLDKAKEFAEVAASLFDRHDLVVLVSLRRQDLARALLHLKQDPWTSFYTDSDLKFTDWRKPEMASQLPRRTVYYLASDEQFDLRMLFSNDQELEQAQLEKTFSAAFGEQVQVEQYTSPHDSHSGWIIETQESRIVVSQAPFNGTFAADACQSDSIDTSLRTSTTELRVIGDSKSPTTDQADAEIMKSVIQCLSTIDLQVVGKDYYWLTADQVSRFFEQSTTKPESSSPRLFKSGEFQGEFCYFDEEQGEISDEYSQELVTALKQFERSSDEDKSLVIQFNSHRSELELVEAEIENIRRTEYGSVNLAVTVLEDSKFDISIKKGDRLLLPPRLVERFTLRDSGKVTEGAKPTE